MKGKIVLVPFPFTDLTATKLRPALVIHEGKRDVILAFISSRADKVGIYDVVVDRKHPEFAMTGLKVRSVIKLDKVTTLLKDLVIGELGEVGPILKDKINEKLEKLFHI